MRRSVTAAVLAAVVALPFMAVYWRHGPAGDAGLQHWLAVHLGIDVPGSGPAQRYNFYWSGFGSVFPWAMGILGAAVGASAAYYRRHNCHDPGCPWLGRFPDAGGQFAYCGKHHPGWQGKRPTRMHLHEAHRRHVAHQEAMITLAARAVPDDPVEENPPSG